MNSEDKLNDLRKKAKQADSNRDRAKGKLDALMTELESLGCDSVKNAEKQLEEIDSEISKKEKILSKELNKLETDYDWNV